MNWKIAVALFASTLHLFVLLFVHALPLKLRGWRILKKEILPDGSKIARNEKIATLAEKIDSAGLKTGPHFFHAILELSRVKLPTCSQSIVIWLNIFRR
jgi:hypothetical protein